MNQKEWLLITIGVFLTIIAWLVADVYHISKTKQVKAKFNLVKPIRVKIDNKIFKQLEKKEF